MINLSGETEAIARQLAGVRGISPEEAVKVALEAFSKETTSHRGVKLNLEKAELIRRMEEISTRSGARPLVDPRSPDELIGYTVEFL